jgi:DNA repair protein RadC
MESNKASRGSGDDGAEGKESTVTYVRELMVRYRGNKGPSFDPIGAPADAAKLLRQVLPDNVREHFVVLFLDGRHHVVAYFVVSTGTATSCPVGAREIFQTALVAGATALVVAHNHPSGSTDPSSADRAITKRLKEAGELLGIPVLDHLVIGSDEYYSFKDREGI